MGRERRKEKRKTSGEKRVIEMMIGILVIESIVIVVSSFIFPFLQRILFCIFIHPRRIGNRGIGNRGISNRVIGRKRRRQQKEEMDPGILMIGRKGKKREVVRKRMRSIPISRERRMKERIVEFEKIIHLFHFFFSTILFHLFSITFFHLFYHRLFFSHLFSFSILLSSSISLYIFLLAIVTCHSISVVAISIINGSSRIGVRVGVRVGIRVGIIRISVGIGGIVSVSIVGGGVGEKFEEFREFLRKREKRKLKKKRMNER